MTVVTILMRLSTSQFPFITELLRNHRWLPSQLVHSSSYFMQLLKHLSTSVGLFSHFPSSHLHVFLQRETRMNATAEPPLSIAIRLRWSRLGKPLVNLSFSSFHSWSLSVELKQGLAAIVQVQVVKKNTTSGLCLLTCTNIKNTHTVKL